MTETDSTLSVKAGEVLDGKYRVERTLGTGGVGIVVEAYHLQLEQRVAIKFLRKEALADASAIDRFMREARAAAKIRGEHVARVIDVGQLDDGAPFMVMEYLEGSDLSTRLEEQHVFAIEQAVDFVLQAIEALAQAHTHGIVHRDLKPANLFCLVAPDGNLSIKVLDFGISKVTTPGDIGHDVTKTNTLMGSPLYMSPEQMMHVKSVDLRTDIWSLGVILFELITGRAPFEAEAVTELAIKIANEPAPLLRSRRPEAPDGLEEVIAKCLAKDRAHRYANVGELAVALGEFGSARGRASVERVLGTLRKGGVSVRRSDPKSTAIAHAPTLMTTPTLAAPSAAATSSWDHPAVGTKPPGRARWIAVALLLVLAIGAAAFWTSSRTNGVPATPSALTTTSAPTSTSISTASASATSTGTTMVPPASTSATLPEIGLTSPTTKPTVRPHPPPAGSVSSVATVSAVPTAKPSCDPPYYFDANGTRIFKKECL